MRRGAACAVWVVVLSCSPGGGEGPSSVVQPNPSNMPGAGGGSTGGMSGFVPGDGPGGIFDDIGCVNGCAFGPEPILEAGIAAGDIGAFTASSDFQSGALCVLEPQLSTEDGKPGALFPRNWLRPRFRWTSSGGETLWEVRLQNETQPDELRAYTRTSEWTIPAEIWERMGDIETPINVTIRGLGAGGVLTGSKGSFQIAPVDAGGSMVFWATTSSRVTQLSSRLVGFSIGDEGVVPTLSAVDVQTGNIPGEDGALPRGYYACGGEDAPRPVCDDPLSTAACCVPTGFEYGQVECIGCHVSTPDGKAVLFTDNWPWNKVAASIEPGTAGALPATITPFAANLMKQPWLGMQALSPAHFNPEPGGERILISSYGTRPATEPFYNVEPTLHQLAWFNLAAEDPTPLTPIPETFPEENPYGEVRTQRQAEVAAARGTGFGILPMTGEARNAVTPTWSNDGVDIAYVSTDISSTDGHPDWTANIADIRVVPYGGQPGPVFTPPAGGASVALPGASSPDFLEYYPEYSADDAFIAFTRAPNPSVTTRCLPRQAADGSVITCPPQTLGENPDGPYYNRNGEIYVVPRAGGEPIRLAANDPVVCSGETSRGIINSWPKWSPGSRRADNTVGPHEANGKRYYFLIFSSARQYPGSFELQKARLTPEVLNKSSQLYMASMMVDDATGTVTTYPAVYLWNQTVVVDPVAGTSTIENGSNLTPAWDDFTIPEVPPVFEPPR